MAQDKRGEYQRGVQRQGQLDALLRGGATPERLRAGGFLDQANAWEKNSAEVAQKQAAAGKSTADAKATEYKLSRDQIEHLTQGLSQFQSPDDARAYLSDAVARYQAGDPSGMPLHQAKLLLARVPRELNRFGEWKQQALMGVADAKTQMQYTTPDANTSATIKSRESEGGKNRANQLAVAGTVAQAGGQILVTPEGYVRAPKIGTTAQPMTTPDGKPIKPAPKGGAGMSATLQKELIESDDMVQTAQSTMSALQSALGINDQAYSGLGATARAKVASNMPWPSPKADATVQLNNLIGSQALSGMKAIFGGNPTEGERAILMELQASADKTPEQRAEIIKRGIQAAKLRMQMSAERAKSIRSGSYLTQVIDPDEEREVRSNLERGSK